MSAIVVLILLVASTAVADIQRNKSANVSVDIPRAWKVTAQDADNLFASDSTGVAAVMFANSDGTTPKTVAAEVDAMLATMARDVKWGPRQPITVGGRKATSMTGSARTGDVVVHTRVVMLITPKGKGVFLLEVVAANNEAAHRGTLDKIAASLKVE